MNKRKWTATFLSRRAGAFRLSNNTSSRQKKGAFKFAVDTAALVTTILVGIIAWRQYDTSTMQAQTDLYVEFKRRYAELVERKKELDPLYAIKIQDCQSLRDSDFVFGDGAHFNKGCTIEYYADKAKYNYLKTYWFHSFDEWFASSRLELSQPLWDKYYKHAIFGALQYSDYQRVLCSLSGGDSSFGGQNMRFRKALTGLYSDNKVIPEYYNRWTLASSVSQNHTKIFPPKCLIGDANLRYGNNAGFKSQETEYEFNKFAHNLLVKTWPEDKYSCTFTASEDNTSKEKVISSVIIGRLLEAPYSCEDTSYLSKRVFIKFDYIKP